MTKKHSRYLAQYQARITRKRLKRKRIAAYKKRYGDKAKIARFRGILKNFKGIKNLIIK